MKQIQKQFNTINQKGQAGLIGFITAGDPTPIQTPQIAEALIKGGVDILELGIPFSDPIADGLTVQNSTHRALEAGTTPKTVFRIVKEIRKKHNLPIVILTYFNPVFRIGFRVFFEQCRKNCVDGIVIPDLPYDEAKSYISEARRFSVDTVFLATPTSSAHRLRNIINHTSGFLYLVSLRGVTGARQELEPQTLSLVEKVHSMTNGIVPLAVGFGISKPEHIRLLVRSGAEGAIVGSAFIRIIETYRNQEKRMLRELESYTATLKQATIKEGHV